MNGGSLSDTQRTMVLPLLQETNIIGKPYVTVSAKGIANGLSRYPNDGADFGPDTTSGATAPGQYGSPYSQTTGIQEGLDYLESIGGGHIHLSEGVYFPTVQINIPNTVAIHMSGVLPQYGGGQSGGGGTTIVPPGPLNAVISLVTGTSELPNADIFENFYIAAYNNPNYGMYFNNPNYPSQLFSGMIVRNVTVDTATNSGLPGPQSGYTNPIAGFYFGGLDIRLYNLIYASSSGSTAAQYSLQLVAEYESIRVYDFKSYTTTSALYADVEALFLINCVTTGITTTAPTVTVIGGSTYDDGGSVMTLLSSSSHGRTNSVICVGTNITFSSGATIYIGYYGTTSSQIFVQLIGSYFEISNSTGISLIANGNVNSNIASYASLIMENTQIVNQQTGVLDLNPFDVTPSDTASNWYFRRQNVLLSNATFTSNKLPDITPSVPASGTAQQNTNLYAVDVYLYGGTVTEIQITKGGTAYTVFSNSTGLALSGQVYKLNPGDSITVTYTAAPTWEWLSD